jgi:membrane peptidoglycan carboxypeptidase
MSINRHTPEDDTNSRPQRETASDSPNKPTGDTQLKSKASTDGVVNAQRERVEEEQGEGKNPSTQKMAAVKRKNQEPKDISKSTNQESVRLPANTAGAQPTRVGVELARSVEAKPMNSVEAKPEKAVDAETAKPTNSVEAKPAERKSVPATPITPAPRPRFDHVVTPQQEEAANRLERKRRRMRRGTDITPVVKGGAEHEQEPAGSASTPSEEQTHRSSSAEAPVADKPTEALTMKSPESTREKPMEVGQERRSEADLTELPTEALGMKSPESTGEKSAEIRQERRSEADLSEVPTEAFAMKSSDGALTKRSEADLSEVPTAAFAMKSAAVRETPAVEVDRSRDLDLWRAQRQRKWMLRHISRKRMRESRVIKQRVTNRVWLTVFSIFLTLMAIFLMLTGAGSFAAYQFYSNTTSEFAPQIVNLRDLMPKDNLKIYDSKGVVLDQLTDNGVHTTVPLSQISKQIVNAEVSTEDKNFWTNPGIDVARIFQSAMDDLRYGHVVAGGSTITQQLIKNLVVGDETSLQRKVQEVMLTPIINDRYSKADIMEMYLNTVYYGEQAYGVDAAANIYYGIADQPGYPAAEKLDLAQSAMMAGIVSSPSAYDPLLHPQLAFERFDIVLNGMVANGYATRAEADAAAKEAHSPHFFKSPVNMVDLAPHFDQFVEQQLEQSFHLTSAQLSRSGMKVYTTLDIGLQNKIQKVAQTDIAALSANNVTNAAEVLIDFHTGAILSMLGSIDYNDKTIDGQFNVATAYRQPGSSFKPYVYVTAFQNGISPGQAINDNALTIQLPGGDPPTFSPHNYDMRYHGAMTLRCALQNSLNIPAVKVLQHVGIDAAMKTAYNMGVTAYNGTPGYSLVLGGLGVTLLEHTSAYGTFANGGVHVPYYAVQKIVFSSTGQTIEHTASVGTQVISPQLAYMMTNVLSDNTDRLPEFFDCNVLQLYSNSQTDCYGGNRGTIRPAAAKTGTTNDFKDNWTMGYTSDYVMGVWAGNDNDTPMYGIQGVQGAAPIWHEGMLLAEQGHPIRDFTNPGGLAQATITYPDGLRTTDWFLADHVPTVTNNNGDNGNGNGNGDNGNGNGGNTQVGNSNNGNAMINMGSTLGSPLRRHPDHNNNGNNGDNGNGSSKGTGGSPYCPNDFSFTGGGSSASGLSVW